ncbi:MAG TPA: hypothetical protein VFQ50_05830 [Flavobacterium sp.]|nr:hypothetical protein [Flavobacterium sp.]
METIKLKYWRHWTASLTAVFAISIVMMSGPKYNVFAMLKLEFSKTQRAFFDVIQDYGYSDKLLNIYLYLDFVFIVTFSALFCMSLRLIFELMELRGKNSYMLLCLVPGILDVIEDVLMLYMINNDGISDMGFSVFVGVATLKWTTVIPFILMSLVVLIYQISVRISKIYRKFEKTSAIN